MVGLAHSNARPTLSMPWSALALLLHPRLDQSFGSSLADLLHRSLHCDWALCPALQKGSLDAVTRNHHWHEMSKMPRSFI
ncbi:hypothetical protein Nepgr_003135 [Nepenthes gracilis]|uniref:Uncharacterized protein n=1 Tax=Nepenthes gracilis TaxID=150966 RepID=A0AAD3RYY0_NEPGR|nr:hypothetical protein Nepgr_003135 [Nepenthes gracilis]